MFDFFRCLQPKRATHQKILQLKTCLESYTFTGLGRVFDSGDTFLGLCEAFNLFLLGFIETLNLIEKCLGVFCLASPLDSRISRPEHLRPSHQK